MSPLTPAKQSKYAARIKLAPQVELLVSFWFPVSGFWFLVSGFVTPLLFRATISGKPETRNQKPETRNHKPETRNQKPISSSPALLQELGQQFSSLAK